jgi:hypothetical protein
LKEVDMQRNFIRFCSILILLGLSFAVVVAGNNKVNTLKNRSTPKLEKTTIQEHKFKQPRGFQIRVWESNNSSLGRVAGGSVAQSTPPDGFGLEYPENEGIEHLFGAGPWIGAIVDTGQPGHQRSVMAVTTGYEGWSGPLLEFFGNPDGRDSFFLTDIRTRRNALGDTVNRRGIDDDHDGRVDEDELDGIDNDGDGKIDEDYGAVSEMDAYVGYTDTSSIPSVRDHIPLGIKVWQRSFAWRTLIKEPILPFEYYFVNVGNRILDSVYVGFFADCDVGPVNISSYYQRNFAAYLEDVRTAYEANPIDRPTTPIGITVLQTPKPLDSLGYTFQWYPGPNSPPTDAARYALMSLGRPGHNAIRADEFPSVSDSRFFFSFGPFARMKPGDTLKIVVALVSGRGIKEGRDNLHDNASRAIELNTRGFTVPPVPPSPPLIAQTGKDRITLHWSWPPPDTLDYRIKFQCDPLQTWDDSNKFVSALPDTHWRRKQPELRCGSLPTTGQSGGRIFEGFRVWRSVSIDGEDKSYALLAQYVVKDNVGTEDGDSLKYTFVDSNLVVGRTYWYSVTSFSLPGQTLVYIPDTTAPGGVRIDTLLSPATESALSENSKKVIIPFDPSTKVGDVKVVPNPYRTDVDYTSNNGGYEGVGQKWNESKRVIWFIHLPPNPDPSHPDQDCSSTIRIFTLAGDLVTTLYHDDKVRLASGLPKGQEEWNLISESGRAIASGIYVYTVESCIGKQIGKFVIIR